MPQHADPEVTMPFRPAPHQPSRLALVALSLVVAACATTPRASAPHASQRVGGPRDPITRAEIARIAAADAWEVVRTLRGSFLNSRGITSLQRPDGGAWPVVFVDGMYLGTLDELRGIPASTIDEVRFLNAGDAMLRYGAGYTAGIIQVTTRR